MGIFKHGGTLHLAGLAFVLGIVVAFFVGSMDVRPVCPVVRPKSRLAELDERAAPYFRQAREAVKSVASAMTDDSGTICWSMVKDKLGGGNETAGMIGKYLAPVMEPCRKGAAIYGVDVNSQAFADVARGVASDNLHTIAWAGAGLGMEALFIGPTLASLWTTIGATAAEIASWTGVGAGLAAADGPFPFGDLLGLTMGGIGVATCISQLNDASDEMRTGLESALAQMVDEVEMFCRLSVDR